MTYSLPIYGPTKAPLLSVFEGKLYLSILKIHQRLLIVLEMASFLESLSVLHMYEAKCPVLVPVQSSTTHYVLIFPFLVVWGVFMKAIKNANPMSLNPLPKPKNWGRIHQKPTQRRFLQVYAVDLQMATMTKWQELEEHPWCFLKGHTKIYKIDDLATRCKK